jgi:hypothetical protein
MEPSTKKQFLLLLSLSKANAAVGRAVLDGLKKIDTGAVPAWIDSHGVGIFFTTDIPAWRIWAEAFPTRLEREDQMVMKDLLIVQVGPGWFAGDPQTKYGAWLNARFPRS